MARWISAVVVAVLFMVIVAVTISTGRYWAIAAALIGLAVTWSLSEVIRLTRGRRVFFAIAAVIVPGLVGLGFGLVARPASSPTLAAAAAMPVVYSGSGEFDGESLVLREEVVLADRPATPPAGWTSTGGASFARTRSITPVSGTPVSSSLRIRLDLGSLTVGGRTVPLAIGDGSRVVLTLPRAAVGATSPASDSTQSRTAEFEVTTIPIGREVAGISVTAARGHTATPCGAAAVSPTGVGLAAVGCRDPGRPRQFSSVGPSTVGGPSSRSRFPPPPQ